MSDARLRFAALIQAGAPVWAGFGVAIALTLPACGTSGPSRDHRPPLQPASAPEALRDTSQVRAVKKAIKSQIEEKTEDHESKLDPLDIAPTGIWHVWYFEGLLKNRDAQDVVYAYKVTGTYDILTKTALLTDKAPVDVIMPAAARAR